MIPRPLLLALLLAVLAAPARAQAPEPELSPLVEGLEVVAKAPGPALWRVSRGDSQVVILGTVSPVLHQLTWDDARLRRNLTGARQLLVPSRPTGGAKAILAFALRDRARLRVDADQPLSRRLPPTLAARFAADAAAARQPVSKYDRWKPTAAGLMLLNDFDKAAGLSRGKPIITVTRLAGKMRVPVKSAGRLDVADVLKDGTKLDDAQNLACLTVLLEQLERLAGAPGELGRAWANADLRAVNRLYTPRGGADCPLLDPLLDREVGETAALVEQALKTPGRSVAVVDMSLLLRPGGVLDRLSAAGARVDTP